MLIIATGPVRGLTTSGWGNQAIIFMDKKSVGKRSKAQGKAFELKVYNDLKTNYSAVTHFHSKFDLGKMELVQAKPKWINGRLIMLQGGFPDFVAWDIQNNRYPIGIECKMDGELTENEKIMCHWLVLNNIFYDIYIASKTKVKNKIVVVYESYREKYMDWRIKYGR